MFFKDLIPHFAKHYVNFDIYTIVNGYDCEPGMLETLEEYNFNILNLTYKYETVRDNVRKLRRYIRKLVKPKEWFMVADPDEFHEFPAPIYTIIEDCEKRKRTCHKGKFVDRFAKDGSIPPIKPDLPLSEQFPIQGDISKIISFGHNDKKLVLIRGPQFRSPHWHPNSTSHFPIKVHHYKWTDNSISRLKLRAERYKRRKFRWWQYSQEILDYLEKHKRFPIKELQND